MGAVTHDHKGQKFLIDGEEICRYTVTDGRATVTVTWTYECAPDEIIVPLSYFTNGLAELSPLSLTVETDADSVDLVVGKQTLLEKQVKVGGYKWEFHKTDVDNWPSPLHGHDYESMRKLDAITGDVFDVNTKACVGKLKSKQLDVVHNTLRSSSDFRQKIAQYVDGPEPDAEP